MLIGFKIVIRWGEESIAQICQASFLIPRTSPPHFLQELKARIEKETGQTLPTGPSEVLPPLASRGGKAGGREGRREREQWHLVVRNLAICRVSRGGGRSSRIERFCGRRREGAGGGEGALFEDIGWPLA